MAFVDLIASNIGLVRSDSDITPTWIESVLHSSGALEDGVSVTGVAAERIGEGVGILSILQRVTVKYSAPTSAPTTVVVKYPTDDAGQRFTADALVLYAREIVFYRDHAPSAPFRTPVCYGAAIAADSTDFTVVMEDVGNLRALNQLDGVSLDDAGVLLDVLADFHAQWWNSPKLPSMQGTFPPLSNPTYHMVLPSLWEGGWPGAVEHASAVIPAGVESIGGLWAEKCKWMLDNLMTPETLCHGDYRADNLMFDGSQPAAIDFQIVGCGSGIYDVGYFISQSIDPDVRKGHDRELVDRYVARLATHGITVDKDEVWRQYQIVVCFCVIYSVTNYPQYNNMNERGQALLRDMLERSLRAVADNDALSVLG
ncbi:MAG: phosphotransferase [Ilumatobacteraceae bacterium]|jgi:hypothetical protein